MKKIIFFTIAVLTFANWAYSQPYNVVTDGAGDATTNYVMKFEDGGTYKAKNSQVYDDGTYVSLGTTSPLGRFHIAGTDFNSSRTLIQRSSSLGWGPALDLVAKSSDGNNIQSGRALGYLNFYGEYSADAIAAGATIRAYTTENWGVSGYGSKIEFLTVPNASTTSYVRMTINQDGAVQLNGSTSGYVGLKPPAAAGSTTYTLPSADGTSGQVLQTNGSGTLSWLTTLIPTTGWSTTGNSGTTDGTHFIGTTDNVPFNIKVNNQKAGRIDNAAYNAFFGYQAGNSNTNGIDNTAVGDQALYSNTSGIHNTAIGRVAIYSNTSGAYNTAFGVNSLYYNTTGSYNTAIGESAFISNNATGDYNTALGYAADRNGTYTGSSAIGRSATVTSSNDILLGTSAIDWNGGYQLWSSLSDGRFKFNVNENVKGLEFINKLRPVTYQMNAKMLDDFVNQNFPDSIKTMRQQGIDFNPATAMVHSGFIAQEVEQAALDCGFQSTIVNVPANSSEYYSLAYAEIVVPLVKAVQEQQSMIDSMKVVLQNLTTQGTINKNLQNTGSLEQGNSETRLQIELTSNNQPILYQNEPNPFGESTVIRYFIPDEFDGNVYIAFYDMYGKEIKKSDITVKGFGNIDANTENLASGIYSYSLIVNDKVIETKKMLKTKK